MLSGMTIHFVSILFCVIVFVTLGSGKYCKNCLRSDSAKDCPKLPKTSCEPVPRPCSCCYACARNLGEECSGFSPRCADGLMCVNGKGEALEEVPWHMNKYRGFCQNVVVQPVVIENKPTVERRNRI